MSKLNSKKAVVTGGNSGIGFYTVKDFIENGAKVIFTGQNKDAVFSSEKELSGKAVGFTSNQSSLKDIEELVAKTEKDFGKIDILFINAGVATLAPFEMITEEQFDKNMDVNFKGAFFTLQKFLPILNEGASVIFLSSINAYTGMPNTSVYAASKAALNSLMRTAATELSSKKIRVNAVCPGPISTPLFGKVGLPDSAIQEFGATMQKRIPLKRFGTPEEVAKLVSYLASDDASFITGSEFVIDGGLNVNSVLA